MNKFFYGVSRLKQNQRVEVAHYLGWYVYISLKSEIKDCNYTFSTPDEVLNFLLYGDDNENKRALSLN